MKLFIQQVVDCVENENKMLYDYHKIIAGGDCVLNNLRIWVGKYDEDIIF